MDQAALQRVTLARPSGTLCGTVWGAREQQRLRTWIECRFSESVASRWPTRWDWLALCFLGFFLVCFLSPVVLGPVSCGLFASACSGCPFMSGVIWSVCFLCGFVLWCRGFLLAFYCCCCLFLGCFARLCFWCVGLLRLGSLVGALLVPPSGYLSLKVTASFDRTESYVRVH